MFLGRFVILAIFDLVCESNNAGESNAILGRAFLRSYCVVSKPHIGTAIMCYFSRTPDQVTNRCLSERNCVGEIECSLAVSTDVRNGVPEILMAQELRAYVHILGLPVDQRRSSPARAVAAETARIEIGSSRPRFDDASKHDSRDVIPVNVAFCGPQIVASNLALR